MTYVGSTCAGSMIRANAETLLFSHNHGPHGRANLTLWTSHDSGATWQWLTRVGSDTDMAAYSTLAALTCAQ